MLTLGIYLVLALVGPVVALRFYKANQSRVIKKYAYPSLYPSYSEITQSFERQEENELQTYRIISIGFAAVWVLLVLNYRFNFVDLWIAILVVGLFIAFAYNSENDTNRFSLNQQIWRISLEDIKESSISGVDVHNPIRDELRIKSLKVEKEGLTNTFKIIAVTILVSIYAFNQSINNAEESRLQDEYQIQQVESLVDAGWCGEFSDIKVYDGGATVVKSGGWPCIVISNIDQIEMSENEKGKKVCFTISLDVENGKPGEELFRLDQDHKSFCVKDWGYVNGIGYLGLDKSRYEEKIFKYVGPRIEVLASTLCGQYRANMSTLEYSTYC